MPRATILSSKSTYLWRPLSPRRHARAPSCSLRNNQGFIVDTQPPAHIGEDMPAFRLVDKIEADLDDETTELAATMALAWSRAWNGGGPTEPCIGLSQARYQNLRNWRICRQRRIRNSWPKNLVQGHRFASRRWPVAINGIPLMLASTVEHISKICKRYIVITPGREKKESIANRIYKSTGLAVDDIYRFYLAIVRLSKMQDLSISRKAIAMNKVKFGAEGWNNRFRGDGWAYGKNPMLGLLRESNRELAKHWFQQMEKVGMRFGLPLKDMKPKSSIYPMLVKKNVHYWLRKKV